MKRIYGLADPLDGAVRYVGQTKLLLCQRLGQHVANARKGAGGNGAVRIWIGAMLTAGRRPNIVLLDMVSDERADEAEVGTIAQYQNLLNVNLDCVARPPLNWRNQPAPLPEGIEPLLGTMSDEKLAKQFGTSRRSVLRWRQARGIPSYAETSGRDGKIKAGEPHRRWTKKTPTP